LLAVRAQIAALTLRETSSQQEAIRRQLAQLVEQEQELSKRLGRAGGRAGRTHRWVELQDVRQALPENSVLIELARFRVWDFQGKGAEPWQAPHFAAWIIPAKGRGEVRLIDLGEAERIEDAVRVVRRALHEAPRAIRQQGEPESEKELRRPLETLAGLILRPLLKEIGPTERWLISPDASLWLVPWGALPLPEGPYAIEKHRIDYLVTGRDLLSAVDRIKPGRAVVMADPDYDLEPDQARGGNRDPEPESELRSAHPVGGPPRVRRLPGTAQEAAIITPRQGRYAGKNPLVYTDSQALEATFKALRQPRVLVLSTHGYFLEDQEAAPAERSETDGLAPVLTKEGKPLENPLLRCGLLLAGCNQRKQAIQLGEEDGVLTGLEIVGTDLRGTELAVLSACETGLGQVRNGEGVAGLRQAFQLAGAQAVVATLWQIPDRDSAQLMIGFFDNLAAGQGKADALREAQLTLIQAHRARYGAAHPFFWAAFTLTGQ
jgi:CHAT domain-containing protein